MFIQIIQGQVHAAGRAPRAGATAGADELGPGADGWLGGTYGFTDDDLFVGGRPLRVDARPRCATPSGPSRPAWAEQMMALFDGPVEFHDCDDVTLLMDGGSDDAGFVQVIRGKVDDPAPAQGDADRRHRPMLHEMRPEILGATLAIEPDGTFTETVAFTDEASARSGERQEPPADDARELEYAMQGATFYDLHHPWFSLDAEGRPTRRRSLRRDRSVAADAAGSGRERAAGGGQLAQVRRRAEPVAVLLGQLVGAGDERRRGRSAPPVERPRSPVMNCAAPPVIGGKPMPMIEPMLAAAADSITPSSKHFAVSSASTKSSRSLTSSNGSCSLGATGKVSARPDQSRAACRPRRTRRSRRP